MISKSNVKCTDSNVKFADSEVRMASIIKKIRMACIIKQLLDSVFVISRLVLSEGLNGVVAFTVIG